MMQSAASVLWLGKGVGWAAVEPWLQPPAQRSAVEASICFSKEILIGLVRLAYTSEW